MEPGGRKCLRRKETLACDTDKKETFFLSFFFFFNAQVTGEKTKAQRAYIFSLGSQSDSNQGDSS